jgi:hypothetical protein
VSALELAVQRTHAVGAMLDVELSIVMWRADVDFGRDLLLLVSVVHDLAWFSGMTWRRPSDAMGESEREREKREVDARGERVIYVGRGIDGIESESRVDDQGGSLLYYT